MGFRPLPLGPRKGLIFSTGGPHRAPKEHILASKSIEAASKNHILASKIIFSKG